MNSTHGIIHKPSGQISRPFWPFLVTFTNKTYVIKWSFDYPDISPPPGGPLNCLCMTPIVVKAVAPCIQIASSLSVLLLDSMELNIIEVAYDIVEVSNY